MPSRLRSLCTRCFYARGFYTRCLHLLDRGFDYGNFMIRQGFHILLSRQGRLDIGGEFLFLGGLFLGLPRLKARLDLRPE